MKSGIFKIFIIVGAFFIMQSAIVNAQSSNVYVENFETYSIGSIVGQVSSVFKSWEASTGIRGIDIDNNEANSGILSYHSTTTATGIKTGSLRVPINLINNIVQVSYYAKENVINKGFAFRLYGPLNSDQICSIAFVDGGSNINLGGASAITIGTQSTGWHEYFIELDGSSKQCRAKIDNGNWSSYVGFNDANSNELGFVVLETGSLTGDINIDDIVLVDSNPVSFGFRFPQDSYIYRNDFNAWSLNVSSNYSTSSLKMLVGYGISSGVYSFNDSAYIISSNIDGIYGVRKNTRLIQSTATSTWYAQAGLYADYNSDGIYNNLVASSSQIQFIMGPGSYSSGETLLNGEQVFYNYYNPPTATTTVTTKCSDSITFLGINLCEFSQAMFVPPERSLYQFTALWQQMANKAPWGYVTVMYQRFPDLVGTTSTSTVFSAVNVFIDHNSYIKSLVDLFKIFVVAIMWLLTIWLGFKILLIGIK